LREKQPQAAEAVLRKVLEQAPNDLTSATLLTQAYLSQHRGDQALQTAEKLVEKRPKRAVFHVLLGDARQLTGDHSGAIEAFRTALTLDPSSREAKQRLAHFGEESKPN
jgi:cytochrome c-type biogenesis protein CcmH/NrfG